MSHWCYGRWLFLALMWTISSLINHNVILQRIKRNSSCIWRWALRPEFLWFWRCWLPGCGGRNGAEGGKPNRFIHLIPSRPLLMTLAMLITTLIWLVYRCHLLRRSSPNSPAWTERWTAGRCPAPKVSTRPSTATPASTVSPARYAVPLSKKVTRIPVVSSATGTTVTIITARQHLCFLANFEQNFMTWKSSRRHVTFFKKMYIQKLIVGSPIMYTVHTFLHMLHLFPPHGFIRQNGQQKCIRVGLNTLIFWRKTGLIPHSLVSPFFYNFPHHHTPTDCT